VVVVGDGINETPALAQADVGMSIDIDAEIAIAASEVVLLSGNLSGIINAIALSQRTLRTILQNFVWAHTYNIALIPLAAGVFYPLLGILLSPMLAAGVMSHSSLFVVGNSL